MFCKKNTHDIKCIDIKNIFFQDDAKIECMI